MSELEEPLQGRIFDVSVKDPVCGMMVDPSQARGKAAHAGETYYFCSPGCMQKFVSAPEKYLPGADQPQESALPETAARKLDKDPVCGMTVDATHAAASVEYGGRLYHFCSRGCAEKFKGDQEKYLSPKYKPGGMTAMVQLGAKPVQIAAAAKLEKDPVCGMSVDPARAAMTAAHNGKTYYFCCQGCGEKFKVDPERYLSPSASAGISTAPSQSTTPPATSPTMYICPMDPEVRQPKPGACPKCGMVLEPETITAAEEENPELHDMTRRFWTSVLLGVPLVAYAMLRMGPLAHIFTPRVGSWIEFALATPIVLWCGGPFFARGWASVKFRSPNMFTLIAMGVGVAYAYSTVATIAPGIFPQTMRGMHGQPEVYFEAAAAIIALVLLGQVLELKAR